MSKETQNELHSLYPPGTRIPGEAFLKDIERIKAACLFDLQVFGTAAYRIENGTIHHVRGLAAKNARNTEKRDGNTGQ